MTRELRPEPAPHRVLPGLERRYAAIPASVPVARREAIQFLRRLGASEALEADAALALTEAVTNAVVHGYRDGRAGVVELRGHAEAAAVTFAVRDYGCGPVPHPEGEGLGIGLALIAALASDFRLLAREPGSEALLCFGLRR